MRSPNALSVALASVTAAALIAAAAIGFNLWRGGWWPFTVEVASPLVPAPQLDNEQAERYSGVAQIREDSACTGWLLDTQADGPAYLITNGHCTQARNLLPTEVGLDLPAESAVTFGRGGRASSLTVKAKRVVYSSMNGTDVSVVELNASLPRLRNNGIEAYRPAPQLPSGRLVDNVGVPVQGVPAGQIAPRIGQCVTGEPVGVIELGWFFDGAQAVDCPGILGGSSGSPLFDRTDRVVGMITTTTAGATAAGGECWLNKPCERTESGARVVPDTSYAVGVQELTGCFPDGRFALADGCSLPRPGLVASAVLASVNAGTDTISAELTAPRPTSVWTGVAPLTDADACADPATYERTVAAGQRKTVIQTDLPTAEGFYVWCLQDVAAPDQPARVVLQRDLTPPARTPRLSVEQGKEGVRVQPVFSPPELSDFRIKYGPAASTDCADTAGYVAFRRVPAFIPADALPVRFCYVGADLAGNETPVFSRDLS
ncbi:S1 family peptidase [Microlunatus ginsengisoli]|uniref:Trypsin-like peptidase domain-containing protein n=1 Tax=Microlunatus ginsengisoli TaxID=363863 RepID=A0ABP6ZKX4_9ACTN